MVSLAPWASLFALYLASGTTAPAFVMDPSGHGSDVCLLQFMHKGTSLGTKTTEGMEEMTDEAGETTDEAAGSAAPVAPTAGPDSSPTAGPEHPTVGPTAGPGHPTVGPTGGPTDGGAAGHPTVGPTVGPGGTDGAEGG